MSGIIIMKQKMVELRRRMRNSQINNIKINRRTELCQIRKEQRNIEEMRENVIRCIEEEDHLCLFDKYLSEGSKIFAVLPQEKLEQAFRMLIKGVSLIKGSVLLQHFLQTHFSTIYSQPNMLKQSQKLFETLVNLCKQLLVCFQERYLNESNPEYCELNAYISVLKIFYVSRPVCSKRQYVNKIRIAHQMCSRWSSILISNCHFIQILLQIQQQSTQRSYLSLIGENKHLLQTIVRNALHKQSKLQFLSILLLTSMVQRTQELQLTFLLSTIKDYIIILRKIYDHLYSDSIERNGWFRKIHIIHAIQGLFKMIIFMKKQDFPIGMSDIIEEHNVLGMLRSLVMVYFFSDTQLIFRTVEAVIDLMIYQGKLIISNEVVVWLVEGLENKNYVKVMGSILRIVSKIIYYNDRTILMFQSAGLESTLSYLQFNRNEQVCELSRDLLDKFGGGKEIEQSTNCDQIYFNQI